jgi:hypothetical protein
MASDICTSTASQLLGLNIEQAKAQSAPPMGGTFLLLFPLVVADGASGVQDDLHLWAIKLLEMIGHTMGARQALALIPITRKRREEARRGARW